MNEKNNIVSDTDIIETDKDTEIEDLNENGSIYPYDPTKKDIDIREEKYSVHDLVVRKKNKLIIPDFQRKFIWKIDQQSQFIESILLNFPLTPIFLNEDIEGNYIVVDGLQRIKTLTKFLNNDLLLSDLQALPQLNGKNFKELIKYNEAYKAKIEDKQLYIQVIKPSVPVEMVYDIFNRINTGGTKLERQEVRNCIFRGKSTVFLKNIAEMPEFKRAIDNGISDKRMKLREAALRIISFCYFDKNEYNGNMAGFIEDKMKRINMFESNSKMEEIKKKFRRVMILSDNFFKDKNFRIPTKGTRGRINIALMEAVCYFFWNTSDDFLKKNKTRIKRNYKQLIKDESVINAVKSSTGSKYKVSVRFYKTMTILSNLN